MAEKVDHIENRVIDMVAAEGDIVKALADVEVHSRTLEDDLLAIRLERYELTEFTSPRMNMLIKHHKGRNTLAVFLIYIQIKGRTILMKNKYTNSQVVPKKRNTGEPRALPSCPFSSLSGAAPHAPHTPIRQGIKHPIIEAHYGVH